MIKELISLAIPIARLLDRKNKTKFAEKIIELERKIDDEENQDFDNIDDGLLYSYRVELLRISKVIQDQLKKENS